ncbi:hypothetical protein NN3_57870 [Nocardia neocaledoniensis NBRC 108232]|uniref:Uncharacterized protein n=1 Tax=Nocardia neocaledoniensis TaxID=236511 RepID=A0A317P0Z9_9NOCA|nr:hypothetical protein [Nocardia neocaledoniensis]PWV81170.1 hypothetical protein DFR69_101510 [Nocardia neocaledoniensis]GEM34780.1 hypothetical protein NN3_57870 [Nocardia neocaledoniensis NBRC 108232]
MRRCSIALLLSLILGALLAPAARAVPAYADYLDLPAVNAEGEFGGGLHPALPLSAPPLLAALEEARADGIAPARYGTLLHQYWLVVATDNAGIDLASWEPYRGVAANAATFPQVYVNYFRIAAARPDFYWAGLAGLAGGSFASGFFDLGDIGGLLSVGGTHELGSTVADLLRVTPPELVAALPADIGGLATLGPRLSAADLAWYQTRLMIMQKHIFLDLVPMHEAYLADGMAGIDEMRAAGVINDHVRTAWVGIDSGTDEGRADALVRMADREQNEIIADQWDVTAAGRDGMGRVMTYVTTVGGKAAVPGTRAPGQYDPVTVRAGALGLRVPLPDFNWADRDTRWAYIVDDLLPRHLELCLDRARALSVFREPFQAKLDRGRMVARLPELITDLTTQWQVVQ